MIQELTNTEDPFKIKREFHLKEWESLRQEISEQVDHTRKLEFGSVAGLGAFYAWFVSADPQPSRFILVVPTLLALLGAIRALGTLTRIQEIACYIRKIEAHFSLGTEGLIGWDSTRAEPPAARSAEALDKAVDQALKASRDSPFKYSAAMFWVAILVVSVLAWFFL